MPKRRKAKRYTRSVSALLQTTSTSTRDEEDKRATTQKRKVAKEKVASEIGEKSSASSVDEKTQQTKRQRHLSEPSTPSPPPEDAAHKEKEALGKFEEFSREHSPGPQSSTQNQAMAVDWNYDEDDCNCGPQKWPGQIDGKQQSPIDLRLSKMKVITLQDPFQFINYEKPLSGEFVNTGHSVQFIPDSQTESPQIRGGMLDQTYKFIQYHYHWGQDNTEGSEHALCGLRYPAELHLVHQGVDDPSKLAVLGIFLHLGSDHIALDPDSQALPQILESGQRVRSKIPVSLEAKLPDSRASFARYNGSLTTPPCSENVVWSIFLEPVEVSHDQLEILRVVKDYRGSVIRKNYRPLQSVNDRNVFLASC